jgi:hypothetical protein
MTFVERIQSNGFLGAIRELTSHITFELFNQKMFITSAEDKKGGNRVYIQVIYNAPCSKSKEIEQWKGGKHYLSEHMTEDEVLKRVWVAIEAAVKHEVMEGFKFDGIVVFNPHLNFRELLKISHKEVMRNPPAERIPNFDV